MKRRSRATLKRGKPAADQGATPESWVQAGLSLLAREGIDAVRVEPLAERLGVTKGSFYWHFKDRAALHAAMIEAWRGVATYEIIARLEAGGPAAEERLRRLIEPTASRGKAGQLETAIRSWAHNDAAAAKVVAGIDEERIAYVARLLREMGIDPETALLRTKILYLALIGSYFAAQSDQLQAGPELWKEIMRLIR
jgi:AcrR family transcriptional regulator